MTRSLTLTSSWSETPESRSAFVTFPTDDVGFALTGPAEVMTYGTERSGRVAVACGHRSDRVGDSANVLLTRLGQLRLDNAERVLPTSIPVGVKFMEFN